MVAKGVRILNRECQCYVSVGYGADTQSVLAMLCQFQRWRWYTFCFGYVTSDSVVTLNLISSRSCVGIDI